MSKILELRDDILQRLPDDVERKYRKTESDPYFLALALCGETGELANILKKKWRGDSGDRVAVAVIRDEIADIRVYLELLAKFYGIEGDKLDQHVAAKLSRVVKRYLTDA